MPTIFESELRQLINRRSMEQYSGTPDFILAKYLKRCLDAFTDAVQERTTWYKHGTVHMADKIFDKKELLFNCPPMCDLCGRVHKPEDHC